MATQDSTTTYPAFYAQYLGESIILARFAGEPLTLYTPSYEALMTYSPDMATDIVLNGACDLADTAALLDRWHGGAARICTTRPMECQ